MAAGNHYDATNHGPENSEIALVSRKTGDFENGSGHDRIKTDMDMQHEGFGNKLRSICRRFLNNMTAFVLIYSLGLFFYGMSVSYTNSMLISIERRFGFSTKQTGMILAATELGHIAMALIVAHFVGTKNRPRWICLGTVIMGFAMLLFAAPEIIFPYNTYVTAPRRGPNNLTIPTMSDHLCLASKNQSVTTIVANANQTRSENYGVAGPLAVFCISHILHGFGSTTPMVLGMPYIDDNVSPKSVPLYFGTALFFRLFGPLVGFGVGSVCNNYFHDFTRPSFIPSDPRWISAWYIGFLVIGTGLLIFGILVVGFPSSMHIKEQPLKDRECNLITAHHRESISEAVITTSIDGNVFITAKESSHSLASSASWKEFAIDLKRLLTNFTFVCRTSSMFVDGMIVAGFFNYFPKFYAQQFQMSQSAAALYGGLGFVIVVIAGVVLGSIVIKRFQLRPRHVGLLLVISGFIMCVCGWISVGLGCDNIDIHGLPSTSEFRAGTVAFNNTFCRSSAHCGCSQRNFEPVCETHSNTIFFSPCHAGCRRHAVNETTIYADCPCAAELPFFRDPATDLAQAPRNISGPMVRAGMCPKECLNYRAFTAVLMIGVFFVGLPMSGQIMIQFRIVDVNLKNLCAGVTSVCVAAFGLLPAPIFVGAIVDSTCRLWAIRSGGERGACMLYDNDQLRWKFFLTLGCVKFIPVILDAIVTWKIWNMEFDRSADICLSPNPTSQDSAKQNEKEMTEDPPSDNNNNTHRTQTAL
ncbi:Solute carrier organic anion transporter family member 1A4 [Hypsibius exemplaris]|uniref:Solute carrier organic anion transporter family member n=1 Tax=Hypsibius exemplaris TaxID=2072580 RepID=A0A1W0WJK0_HYPEX|nr:Solute carrier organic anion transporter family member 1A4 [Hypsibius exemplaris]